MTEATTIIIFLDIPYARNSPLLEWLSQVDSLDKLMKLNSQSTERIVHHCHISNVQNYAMIYIYLTFPNIFGLVKQLE